LKTGWRESGVRTLPRHHCTTHETEDMLFKYISRDRFANINRIIAFYIRCLFLAWHSPSADRFRFRWSALQKCASKPCADINLSIIYGEPLMWHRSELPCLRAIVNLPQRFSSTRFLKFPSLLMQDRSPTAPGIGQLFR